MPKISIDEKKRLEEERREIDAKIEQRKKEVAEDFNMINQEMKEDEDRNDRRLQEAEERLRKAEEEEYQRREKGSSSPVIPAAIPRPPSAGYNSCGSGKEYVAGAVSATDSESESEFISSLRGNRPKMAFKWTQESEELLEDILLKNQFEFKAACREFIKLINKENRDTFFTMDAKQLQLRWTDIEIRKYRI